MLALATRPHGPSRMNPPAKSMPGSGCPCASCGVWQSVHPAIVTRYFPRFSGVERSGSGTGASSGCGTLRIKIFHRENQLGRGPLLAHRRQRPQVDDDRCQVFVGHGPEIRVWHERKQRPPVVTDAFADGARQLVVGPFACARFRIGSDVRRIHLSGETLQHIHVLARAERVGQNRRIVRSPVVLRVATHAVCHVPDEVLAARQARRRALKFPRRERARPRS